MAYGQNPVSIHETISILFEIFAWFTIGGIVATVVAATIVDAWKSFKGDGDGA